MPPVQRNRAIPRRPTFFRQWREHRGLTQAQAAERLKVDQSTLSRVERGLTPYDQDFLEAAAFAYMCEPADLLMRDPLRADSVWSIADNLKKATPEQRATVTTIIDALIRKTGS